jgi:hypothetical protein
VIAAILLGILCTLDEAHSNVKSPRLLCYKKNKKPLIRVSGFLGGRSFCMSFVLLKVLVFFFLVGQRSARKRCPGSIFFVFEHFFYSSADTIL